jgi:hypothetical protein
MDLPYLLKVDKYYKLNYFPNTYCIKCNRLETNYVCLACNNITDYSGNIEIYNNNYESNINNIYYNSINCIKQLNSCLDEMNIIYKLFYNFNQELKKLSHIFSSSK